MALVECRFFFLAQPEFLVNLQINGWERDCLLWPISCWSCPTEEQAKYSDWSEQPREFTHKAFVVQDFIEQGSSCRKWIITAFALKSCHPWVSCYRLRVAEIIRPSHWGAGVTPPDRPCGLMVTGYLADPPQTAWYLKGLFPSYFTEGSELPGGLTALSDLQSAPVCTHRHFL